MSPPKYHVYLEYADPAKSLFRFNLTEEELNRTFTTPFQAGKPFLFCGRIHAPAAVNRAVIFRSYEDGGKLVLPNREMVAGHPDKKFVIEKILAGKVKGVFACTERFLPSKK